MNLLHFQLHPPATNGSILFVASSPSWHSGIVLRRLLEVYPDRRIHVIAKHRETLAHQSPRLAFHRFDSPRVELSPAQIASITADRAECAYYAQMVESAWEYAHIFRLFGALGIRNCYAVDAHLSVFDHSGNLDWLQPRRVGPHLLTLAALLSGPELNRLYDLARNVDGTGAVVEIGTMAGGSAVALALGARDSGRSSVYTIDITPRPEVREHLEQHGVADLVTVINMDSRDVATNWGSLTGGNTGIRLLWIDGDHTYGGVWSDILHWRDYLDPGGVICFHDYSERFPGVIRAVYEHVVSSGGFHDFQRVDSIVSAVKKPVAQGIARRSADA